MAHIYTYEEIRQEFEGRDYILITDRKLKCSEKYEYICKKHLEKGSQFIDWGHFHCTQRGCRYCGLERSGAAHKKDLSEYNGKELAESKGFEYVRMVRHDQKIWVQFICPKHREYGVQEMPYNNMKRVAVGCQHCVGRNDDEQVILDEMREVNSDIEVLEPIKGRTKHTLMRCLKHNYTFVSTPYYVISGHGCMYCGFEKLAQSAKTPEHIFVQELKENYENIELVSGYDGKTNYAFFHCKMCDAYWTDIAYYVENRGCPRCNGFSMETAIGEILQQHGIHYIQHKSFLDCRDQRPLPFDFYLIDYDVLIEYDGEQHFKPVNFGSISDEEAMHNFQIVQRHDKMKTDYCREKQIPLIRISYLEKDNIENILLFKLKQHVLI